MNKRNWPDMSEKLPVDILPVSNGEFIPPDPTPEQLGIMALAEAETERYRRRFGMSRRDFVRTGAAMAIGFWAIDAVGKGVFGNFGHAANKTTHACDIEWAGKGGLESLSNLPGEFVFDIQSHHIDPDGLWRVNNPAIQAFFAAVWSQSSPALGARPEVRPDGSVRGFGDGGELDPIANLSRHHYLKELFLDSATTMTVLSAVPTGEDQRQPLPIADAANTVSIINDLAGSQRTVMHAFVMPNRGSSGNTQAGTGIRPVYLDEELALMTERARYYSGFLRGWKMYPAWGDVPNASGWGLDSEEMGKPLIEHVLKINRENPAIPPVLAIHKGFALPGFDQRYAAPRDVGIVAKQYPQAKFVIYHSGHDLNDSQKPYDPTVPSTAGKVDAFIKSLRENNWDASHFIEPGKTFGNVPNVWAELGSVWRDVMNNADQSVHLLGKLITHVGPKRVVWGTDSLWYGSPQPEIVAMRKLQFTEAGKQLYNLPYGIDGDVEDPTQPAPTPERTIRNAILGRNAAEVYEVDPDLQRNAISCDRVQGLRSDYLVDPGTESERAPLATNTVIGARTRRELVMSLANKPWAP